MRAARVRRSIVATIAALAMMGGAFVGWRLATANLATVEPGRIYRSAQMDAKALSRVVHDRRIKTVLNLRGPNPGSTWYREERAAVLAAGATQVDVSMSSCEWMSRAQLQAVVHLLESVDYPLLIHCQQGAERTGLVSAFSELLRPGGSLADARRQFSVMYLFLPVKDGAVMLEHLEQYAAWLKRQGADHSPAQFRRWVKEGFEPRSPSRENWPYDPFPLVLITRPAPSKRAVPLAQTEASRQAK
jgi:protein tyrosine phosphatase (PTP) superfamily phosphohydrolase (DUF442 family)